MENFKIYRNGNYDLKANAAMKAEELGQAAGRIAITSLKSIAIGLLNASEKAITGRGVSLEKLQEIGLK